MNRINQMDMKTGDVIYAHGAVWVHLSVKLHGPDKDSKLPVVSTQSICVADNGENYNGWRIGKTLWNFQGNRLVGNYHGYRPSLIYQGGGA